MVEVYSHTPQTDLVLAEAKIHHCGLLSIRCIKVTNDILTLDSNPITHLLLDNCQTLKCWNSNLGVKTGVTDNIDILFILANNNIKVIDGCIFSKFLKLLISVQRMVYVPDSGSWQLLSRAGIGRERQRKHRYIRWRNYSWGRGRAIYLGYR